MRGAPWIYLSISQQLCRYQSETIGEYLAYTIEQANAPCSYKSRVDCYGGCAHIAKGLRDPILSMTCPTVHNL